MKWASAATLLPILVMAGCADEEPTGPGAVGGRTLPGASLAEVVDATAAAGNPHVYFLPPTVAEAPEPSGTFDGSLLEVLRVEVCSLDGEACAGPPVISFEAEGSSYYDRIRVNLRRQHYIVYWDTDHGGTPGGAFRVTVYADSRALGYVDLVVGDDVRLGGWFPIAFRIEEGALNIPLPGEVGPGGGVLEFEEGLVILDVPGGAVSASVRIAASPTTLPADAPSYVPGTVWDLGPDGLDFNEPVTLSLEYDPALVPEGVDESELRIHKLVDGTFVQQDAGTVDTANHVATAEIDGFSVFVLMEREFPGSPSDAERPRVRSIEVFDEATGSWSDGTTIDLSAAEREVRFRIQATDNLTGVRVIALTIGSSPQYWCSLVGEPPVSGADTNGTWTCSITLPRYLGDVVLRPDNVTVSDWISNRRRYFLPPGSDALCAVDNPEECIGTTGPDIAANSVPADSDPPELVSLGLSEDVLPRSFTPSVRVTSSSSPIPLLLGFEARDNLAGLAFNAWGLAGAFNVTGPSGQDRAAHCVAPPISGTTMAGFFECKLELPVGAEPGLWRMDHFSLIDEVGNVLVLRPPGLTAESPELCTPDEAICFPQPRIEVVGAGDTAAPSLVGYRLRVHGNQVTVEIDVTDEGSGLAYARIEYSSVEAPGQFQSCSASRVSGDMYEGTYSCVLTFPEFSALGEWHPFVSLTDVSGLRRVYSRGDTDGILCYRTGPMSKDEICAAFGETDVILR
jgi:hypothetical protein